MRRRLVLTFVIGALGITCALSFIDRRAPSVDTASNEPASSELADGVPPASGLRTAAAIVRRGDTLVRVLSREGLDRRTSHDIAAALQRHGADMRRVRPRDEVEISWSPDGDPVAVRWASSPWLTFVATATDAGWEVQRAEIEPDVRTEAVGGEVSRSLFATIEALGESAQLVLDFVEIFESDFDFTADTREGDRFRMLVEKRYAGEEFVNYGRILAAQYLAADRVLNGIGHDVQDGRPAYYDLDARSLRKTFLKAPLAFTRITSGFTYRRPHPILGGVRPHLAIDYAAPIGTPVRAVADGLVLSAGWNGGNGIQVILSHRGGYETMYNHLSKAVVKRGARVAQRQVIGHVGSTGLSTGPHLDYRVSRHGRFVDPLSEKFIPGEPLRGPERAEFERKARELVRRLEREVPFETRS